MPIYEYAATDGTKIELIRPMADADKPVTDPDGKGRTFTRVMSTVAVGGGGGALVALAAGARGVVVIDVPGAGHDEAGAGRVGFSLAFTGEGRALRPRRWALPITALRLTPPSSSAIWLAVAPPSHILVSFSIRSSVQLIRVPSLHRAK